MSTTNKLFNGLLIFSEVLILERVVHAFQNFVKQWPKCQQDCVHTPIILNNPPQPPDTPKETTSCTVLPTPVEIFVTPGEHLGTAQIGQFQWTPIYNEGNDGWLPDGWKVTTPGTRTTLDTNIPCQWIYNDPYANGLVKFQTIEDLREEIDKYRQNN